MHHSFPFYNSIIQEEHLPKYLKSKHKRVIFGRDESIESLWRIHEKSLQDTNCDNESCSPSLLDIKAELAFRIHQHCHFCEHRCSINRDKNMGKCTSKESLIASEFLHYGEESMLVPSHTIFFSGCSLYCVFCQNYDISKRSVGTLYTSAEIADRIQYRKTQGSINVNWVGGDPTPHLFYILKSLLHTDMWLPQIWNSNMYCSIETMNLLDGIIDLYLTDFKFGNNDCANRLCGVSNYVEIVRRNHLLAYDQTEMLIRHLVLPGHLQCCSYPIIDFISEHLPNAWVNLMHQYRPIYQADKYPELTRSLLKSEIDSACSYAKERGVHLL